MYNNKLYQSSSWFETSYTKIVIFTIKHNKLYQSSSWFETYFRIFLLSKIFLITNYIKAHLGLKHIIIIFTIELIIITNYIKAHLGLKHNHLCSHLYFHRNNKLYQSSSWFETNDIFFRVIVLFINNKLYQSSSWFETQKPLVCEELIQITNYIKAHLGLKHTNHAVT